MIRMLTRLLFAASVIAPAAAFAETGHFVVRLGRDTTSIERYERDGDRVVVHQVGRAPRLLARQCEYEWKAGDAQRFSIVVTPPGATAAMQTVTGRVDGDTLRIEIRNGNNALPPIAVAFPAGAIAVSYSSPWVGYETLTRRLSAGSADSLRATVYFIGFPAPEWVTVHRLGRDSVAVATQHSDAFHAKVDRAGRLLGVLPIRGTGMYSLDRVTTLDMDGLTASFAAREQHGAGLGTLSPRDTVRTTAGGAALWVDYGRPAKRGRTIFGDVVPYGTVWRTGANAATQFRSDKALDFGGTLVPAGTYTLWTIPAADGWTLVVNSQTGQWGTQHDPAKDLFRIPMRTSRLAAPVEHFTLTVEPATTGGTLTLDWDTTRAAAEFTVKE